jgi:hypothetical protein
MQHNQRRHNLDSGRHARGNPDLDHRQIIQQEESGRLFRCWLDNILQMDRTTPNRIVWERLPTASSFQAEMLGLCALHLLVHVITEFHRVSQWSAIILCNNKRALSLLAHHKGQIQPSGKCADIQESF